MNPNIKCSTYGMDFSQEDFNQALNLIKEAVQGEKDIIATIRDDERNHRKWFKDVYRYYTGEEIETRNGEEFIKPESYLAGISKAVFGELSAMEKYRFIREGLPVRLFRDTVFRIITDEMKHATKYNYILNKNALKQTTSAM